MTRLPRLLIVAPALPGLVWSGRAQSRGSTPAAFRGKRKSGATSAAFRTSCPIPGGPRRSCTAKIGEFACELLERNGASAGLPAVNDGRVAGRMQAGSGDETARLRSQRLSVAVT